MCRKFEGHIYDHKIKQFIYYDQSGPRVAQRGALEEAGRAEQHIFTEVAPNELKSGEGA